MRTVALSISLDNIVYLFHRIKWNDSGIIILFIFGIFMKKCNICLPGCRSGSCSWPEGSIVPIFDKKKRERKENVAHRTQASRSLSPSSRPRTKNRFNDRFARRGTARKESRGRGMPQSHLSFFLSFLLSRCVQ